MPPVVYWKSMLIGLVNYIADFVPQIRQKKSAVYFFRLKVKRPPSPHLEVFRKKIWFRKCRHPLIVVWPDPKARLGDVKSSFSYLWCSHSMRQVNWAEDLSEWLTITVFQVWNGVNLEWLRCDLILTNFQSQNFILFWREPGRGKFYYFYF